MITENELTALVRQSMEPTEAEESRAAVVRLADEIRRLRKAIEKHRQVHSQAFVSNAASREADRELWRTVEGT